MLWARSVMDDWIGEDGGKPDVKTLTAYFLALYVIMATQVAAVRASYSTLVLYSVVYQVQVLFINTCWQYGVAMIGRCFRLRRTRTRYYIIPAHLS